MLKPGGRFAVSDVVTRGERLKLNDALEFLAGRNIDVHVIAPQVDGRIMSACVCAVRHRSN